MNIIAVALGGSLGALSRYFISEFVQRLWGNAIPWGTILVNFSGSFIIGFLSAMFSENHSTKPGKIDYYFLKSIKVMNKDE